MDEGRWHLFHGVDGRLCGLLSDDFTHDVWLDVKGDFADPAQLLAYCEWLRDKLNATPPAPPNDVQMQQK